MYASKGDWDGVGYQLYGVGAIKVASTQNFINFKLSGFVKFALILELIID